MTGGTPAVLRVDLQHPSGRWVPVGLLRNHNEATAFSTFDEYWNSVDRPVVGQVFEQRGPSWRPASTTALPTWFSNLLPEGPLRRAIAADTGVKEQREFFLLARIGGDDLPGALRVVPVEAGEEPLEVDPDEDHDASDDGTAVTMKFSLAGVQLKFSVTEEDRGLTVPTAGDSGTWIAKLPDRREGFAGVPEVEFAALELARAVGIEVPKTRLVDVAAIDRLPAWATTDGGKALLIERFDRKPGGRVHAEELSQILDLRPSRKYEKANFETVARVTAALVGPEHVGHVIDRIVVNVLVGNGDAHVKNWAFTYADGRTPSLSPAYDILPTVLYIPNDDLGLKLNGSREFADVTLAGFARLADKAGWDGQAGRDRAAYTAERVLSAWPVLTDLLTAAAAETLTRRRDTFRRLLP